MKMCYNVCEYMFHSQRHIMIEYDKNLIQINDDDNEGVDLSILTPKSSRLIVVRCSRCDNPWNTRPRELFYNRTSCPVCQKDKEYNKNAIVLSSEYYEVLYPMLIDKSALENRGDTSQCTIDVICPDCSKAFRITISSAIKRIENNSPICWMCDSRKGGRTGELFMYNYPELVSRIRGEVPDTDFLVSDPREFMFEYDCGHSEKIRTRNFVRQHKVCSECKSIELSQRSRQKHVDAVCSKCDTQITIQALSYLYNLKRHKGQYICNICASSKGIRLSEKLRSSEFAHVFWSEKNGFSPSEITASSGRRVILECENGHEWSPFAYAIGGCPQCAQSALVSKQEQSLVDFVCSLVGESRVRTSVRDVIAPKELDVYVPSRGVAVEFNGMYWHSEENGKHRDYHFDKWLTCRDRGVTLISVWEDDWLYMRGVVERVLESALLVNEHSSCGNYDTQSLSIQKVVSPSVGMLDFVKTYGLFEQQCLMDDVSFFVICQDGSGGLVSVSGVFEGPGFTDVRSHVCVPGFECSLSSVVSLLKVNDAEVGVLECNDYPLLPQHTLENAAFSRSRVVDPVRRGVLYAHNRYFRVSKCDVDDMGHVWNSGYTLWYE